MLYVLVNVKNGMYYERENQYLVCQETNDFLYAKTYHKKEQALYELSFLRNDYKVIELTIDNIKELVC